MEDPETPIHHPHGPPIVGHETRKIKLTEDKQRILLSLTVVLEMETDRSGDSFLSRVLDISYIRYRFKYYALEKQRSHCRLIIYIDTLSLNTLPDSSFFAITYLLLLLQLQLH